MRRKRNIKRDIQPDSVYNNSLVAKFINYVMSQGKKSTAQKVVYGSFDIIQQKMAKDKKAKEEIDPLEVFDQAIKNVAPLVEVKSRRIGGAHYQVPREVRGERRIALAFRWIIAAAKARKGAPMAQKLAQEIMDAAQNIGPAIKKKQDTHRMAEANKAFARFG